MIKFMGAFENVKDLPRHPTIREYAFAGRSNVGKSSLINAVLGAKVAKTSNTPGRTRTLNLFNSDDRVWIMDLPGYGYAKASKDEQVRWLKRLEEYLTTRSELKKMFILVDARVGIKDVDKTLIDFCKDENLPFKLIFTKCDGKGAASAPNAILTSAKKNIGLDLVRKEMP